MSQANVSRAKAVRALKNNNNDIVNAIMVRFLILVMVYGLSAILNGLLRSLLINVYRVLFSDDYTVTFVLLSFMKPSFLYWEERKYFNYGEKLWGTKC